MIFTKLQWEKKKFALYFEQILKCHFIVYFTAFYFYSIFICAVFHCLGKTVCHCSRNKISIQYCG